MRRRLTDDEYLAMNELAEAIVEQGGIWKTYNSSGIVEVEPMHAWVLPNGIKVVKVRALTGKPFMEKHYDGMNRAYRTRSPFANRFPEDLFKIETTSAVTAEVESKERTF